MSLDLVLGAFATGQGLTNSKTDKNIQGDEVEHTATAENTDTPQESSEPIQRINEASPRKDNQQEFAPVSADEPLELGQVGGLTNLSCLPALRDRPPKLPSEVTTNDLCRTLGIMRNKLKYYNAIKVVIGKKSRTE